MKNDFYWVYGNGNYFTYYRFQKGNDNNTNSYKKFANG